MKNHQDCAVNEEEDGLPMKPCWAELEGKEEDSGGRWVGGEAMAETCAAQLPTPPTLAFLSRKWPESPVALS